MELKKLTIDSPDISALEEINEEAMREFLECVANAEPKEK